MACLNRICMNIIKDKCISNRNLEAVGLCETYKEYEIMYYALSDVAQRKNVLAEEEFMFLKTWSKKKPKVKKDV